jgi:hypothetical protein
MFYGNQSPHGQNCSANIQGIQGDLLVLTTVHADGEFAPLKVLIESLPGGSFVNLASPDEHVPEIKWRIWVVKERSRAARHSLPFQCIAKLLIIHIVLNAVKMLNFFPTKGGISNNLSPKTIMSGET